MKKDTAFILGLVLGGTLAYLKRDKLEEAVSECTCKLNEVINKKDNDTETYKTFAEDFENNYKKSSSNDENHDIK